MLLTKRFEAATRGRRSSPDWSAIMAVADELNRNNDYTQCHILAEACENSLKQRDPSIIWSTLLVLDSTMKNCGTHFHAAVCTHSMMHQMKRLIKKYWGKKSGFGSSNPIGSLAVQMLQLWTNSFSPRTFPHFSQAYYRLIEKGIGFPAPTEENKTPISDKPVVVKPSSKHHVVNSSRSNTSQSIPSAVGKVLDAAGESLGLLFSLTEDPNAPVPEDLMLPIVAQLKTHSMSIGDLINANMDNESAVRRLLEVNDQIETALKRVAQHHNVIAQASDSDDDSDSSSDPNAPSFAPSKPTRVNGKLTVRAKSSDVKLRSASTPDVPSHSIVSPSSSTASGAPLSTSTNTSSTLSKKKSKRNRASSTTHGSHVVNASHSDLMDFLGTSSTSTAPPSGNASNAFRDPALPATGFSSATATANGTPQNWSSFDAFDFSHSSSAFAPMPMPASPLGSHNSDHTQGSPFTGAAVNGGQFISSPSSDRSTTSHLNTMPSTANPAFNPFALPAATSSPMHPSVLTTTQNSNSPFSSPAAPRATPSPSSTASSSINYMTSTGYASPSGANTERLANTFGKYWAPDAAAAAASSSPPPAQPQSVSNGRSDVFASPHASSTNLFATSGATNGGPNATPIMSAASGTASPQSNSTNPFL